MRTVRWESNGRIDEEKVERREKEQGEDTVDRKKREHRLTPRTSIPSWRGVRGRPSQLFAAAFHLHLPKLICQRYRIYPPAARLYVRHTTAYHVARSKSRECIFSKTRILCLFALILPSETGRLRAVFEPGRVPRVPEILRRFFRPATDGCSAPLSLAAEAKKKPRDFCPRVEKGERPTEIIFEFYSLPSGGSAPRIGSGNGGVEESRLFKVSEIRLSGL